MQPSPLPHSFHDASIETVSVGPLLGLHFGSARISDPELPECGCLRLGAIEDFARVREFVEAELSSDPISRIDSVIISSGQGGAEYCVQFQLDPQGAFIVQCSKLSFGPRPETA